jgi:glycopeptide antibiotics resistance protein
VLSTLLISLPWLAFVVLIAVIVLAPVAGMILVTRPRVTGVLLAVTFIMVAALTLYPESGVQMGISCAVEWPYLAPTAVESTANILLFIPVAFLAGLRWRRPVAAMIGASAVSALIELLQAVIPAIGRACDTSDWITNTLGAVLGGILGASVLIWHRRRTLPDSI